MYTAVEMYCTFAFMKRQRLWTHNILHAIPERLSRLRKILEGHIVTHVVGECHEYWSCKNIMVHETFQRYVELSIL